MAIKRCLPIRTECVTTGSDPEVIFQAPTGTPDPSLASGFLSIINTSSVANDCLMTLTVTDDTNSGAPTSYTIDAQSSLVLELTNVTLIEIVCTSDTPPTPAVFCTATVEMDLQYTAGL